MRLRWFSLVVLCCTLLLSAVPAQAALIPVSDNQPTKITTDQGLYERLVKLRSGVPVVPLSGISPDDKAVLIGAQVEGLPQLAFVNIENGALTPIKFPGIALAASEYVWLDNNTLTFLAVAVSEGELIIGFAKVDRATGKGTVTPSKLQGYPVSLSPNGKRLLVALSVDGFELGLLNNSNSNKPAAPRAKISSSPFTQKIRTTFRSDRDPLQGLVVENLSPLARRNILGAAAANEVPELTGSIIKLGAIDLETGVVTPMFDIPAGTALASAAWSKDGSQIAFSRIYLALVTAGQYSGGQYINEAITRDALGEIAPARNPFLQGNGVDTFDFNTNTGRINFLRAADGNGDTFLDIDWSPDNATLLTRMVRPSRLTGRANPIYIFGESGYLRFYNREGKLISTFDRPEASDITTTPYFISNDEVLLHTTTETNYWFYYYNRVSGEFRRISTTEGFHALPKPSNNSRQLVYHFSSFGQAPEVYRQNWDGSAPVALTNVNAEVTQAGKVRYDPVSFTLANGEKRTGYLLQSANATFPPRNKRVVVWQEGGPPSGVWNQWGDIVERPFNLLPNNDFALLFVPLTGRFGYGVERYKALYQNKAFGSADIDEQAEIVRQMISQGWTSQGSVGITGCSYGGYFATQSSVRHPSLYSAVNAQCTLTDMFTEAQFDQTAAFFYILGTSFTTDPTYYKQVSPLFNASATVRTPTLLFHGTDDFIPIRTAVNYHDQLQRNGIAVNLMGFIGEGHGLAYGPNQLIAAQAQVEWFRQYLQNSAPAVPASNGN